MNRLARMLLGLLGTILGMGAAGCGAPVYGVAPVYGAPSAEYKLSGKVVDATTKVAIPGISLAFQGGTTTSGADGTWLMDTSAFPCGNTCTLSVRDTDGTVNGSYTDLEVALAPTQTTPGSGPFNEGLFEQKDIQVALVAKP